MYCLISSLNKENNTKKKKKKKKSFSFTLQTNNVQYVVTPCVHACTKRITRVTWHILNGFMSLHQINDLVPERIKTTKGK